MILFENQFLAAIKKVCRQRKRDIEMKIKDINNIISVGNIRMRILCDDEEDTSMDHVIENASPQRLVELWSAYTLGNESWARDIIEAYKALKNLEKNEEIKSECKKQSEFLDQEEVPEEKWGVHARHCCVYHGCKYRDGKCPVVHEKIKQKGPCEDCASEYVEGCFND